MQLQITPISGSVGRPSLFGFSVEQSRSFHPTLAGNYWIGQTPTDWYRRAKEALAKYDVLIGKMNVIANEAERKAIQGWVGTGSQEGTIAFRQKNVVSDLKEQVEAFTPPNVSAYQVARRTEEIEKLENLLQTFEAKVQNAMVVYGTLPPDKAITQEQLIAQSQTPGWVVPLAIGAGALGIAALVTVLSGGKG